jgi:hypothetical protein
MRDIVNAITSYFTLLPGILLEHLVNVFIGADGDLRGRVFVNVTNEHYTWAIGVHTLKILSILRMLEETLFNKLRLLLLL